MTSITDPNIETALKAYMADHPEIDSQDSAIAAILGAWFTSHGYLPHGQQGTRPEDLDSTNDD
jgi:hypothetical protein